MVLWLKPRKSRSSPGIIARAPLNPFACPCAQLRNARHNAQSTEQPPQSAKTTRPVLTKVDEELKALSAAKDAAPSTSDSHPDLRPEKNAPPAPNSGPVKHGRAPARGSGCQYQE